MSGRWRVAVAEIQQETGSFLPRQTTLDNFRRSMWLFGPELRRELTEGKQELAGAYRILTEEEADVVPLLGVSALPWGPLTSDTELFLLESLRDRLASAGRLDAVLLVLHGAMVSAGNMDVDGTILRSARAVAGPRPLIVATLDPHAHITPRMVSAADALVCYDTVPHTDYFETGERAARLMCDFLRKGKRPRMAWSRVPMITPAESHDTSAEPMLSLVRLRERIAGRAGVASCSLAHVQPWLDVPGLGWASVVVAEDDADLAQRCADELAAEAWRLRERFLVRKLAPHAVVEKAAATDGMTVVSDSGDNTGGGGPGDSTVLLSAVLQAGVPVRALITMTDPAAAEAAARAGAGAEIDVELGGKIDHSAPVRLRCRVRALPDGRIVSLGATVTGAVMDLGRTAILQAGLTTVIATENAFYNVGPDLPRQLGVEPLDYQLVQTKSPCGFRAGYGKIARQILLMRSPGFTTSDFQDLPWRNIDRPLFPLDKAAPDTGAVLCEMRKSPSRDGPRRRR